MGSQESGGWQVYTWLVGSLVFMFNALTYAFVDVPMPWELRAALAVMFLVMAVVFFRRFRTEHRRDEDEPTT